MHTHFSVSASVGGDAARRPETRDIGCAHPAFGIPGTDADPIHPPLSDQHLLAGLEFHLDPARLLGRQRIDGSIAYRHNRVFFIVDRHFLRERRNGGPGNQDAPRNQENPELYSIYPFAVIDAYSPATKYERMVRTFRMRNYPNRAGWSQCGVQAARLHLPDTVKIVLEHAKRQQHYPYGGWNSPGKGLTGSRFGVSDAPYLDSPGVNTTALQEMLIQSLSGKTDLLPAVPENWSGKFRLRSRDGHLYDVEFGTGKKIQSVRKTKLSAKQ